MKTKNNRHYKEYVTIVVLILILTGCSIGENVTTDISSVNSVNIVSEINGKWKNFKLFGFVKPPNGMSIEDFQKENQRLLTEYIQTVDYQNHEKVFYQQLRNAQSLSQIHQATKAYFVWIEGLPSVLMADKQQMVAQSILRTYFLDAPVTLETQQAIDYYVQLLIKHRVWGATELYAPALLSLRGYWTEEKITQTAQKLITSRFPTFNTQNDFLTPAAWCALKSGYSKNELNNMISTHKESQGEFEAVSIQKAASRLVQEYQEYIRLYPNRKLPQIPRVDSKGSAIELVDEMQGLAVLALIAKIQ